jgi:ribosomal protein S27E
MLKAAMGRATPSLREAQSAGRDSTLPSAPQDTAPTMAHFATATHEALFQSDTELRCDMCGATLSDDTDEGGAGALVWARGEEVRREKIPLCGECGTVVFASAVLRFDLDDEE